MLVESPRGRPVVREANENLHVSGVSERFWPAPRQWRIAFVLVSGV